jgi:hypothetical protein
MSLLSEGFKSQYWDSCFFHCHRTVILKTEAAWSGGKPTKATKKSLIA